MKKQALNSVLKNVPLELRDKLMSYQTKPSIHRIRWKFRQPKKGCKYGWGGTLKREEARSADMYVDSYQGREELKENLKHIMENYRLKEEKQRLLGRIDILEARLSSFEEFYRFIENESPALITGIKLFSSLAWKMGD